MNSEPGRVLHLYMADVSRHPMLTAEGEHDLTMRYRETKDPKLAERLVAANLRLVVKIAWEYGRLSGASRRAAFDLLDLIQEGNVGLMRGVAMYDPARGVKLSTYAGYWIRAGIVRYVMNNWRLVKLGTTQAQRKLFFNLRREKELLARQGLEPETGLLARRMEVREQDVVDMDCRLGGDELSLEAPFGADSQQSYSDVLPHDGPAVDDTLADQQIVDSFKTQLSEFATALSDRERFICRMRLMVDDPMTLQEIGDHYGLTRERARQIEAKVIRRLKAYVTEGRARPAPTRQAACAAT